MRIGIAVVLALLALFCFFEGKVTPASAQAASQGQPAGPSQRTQNPLQMSIEMQPPRPRKDVPFTLVVRVLDPAANPVADAAVHATLSMSTADRGRRELDLINAGNGIYRIESAVPTPGAWEVWLTARRGRDSVQQYTPFQVEP